MAQDIFDKVQPDEDIFDKVAKKTAGQRGMPPRPGETGPQNMPPSDYGLSKILPSGRTVLQSGGAMAGGLLGAPGGPAGVVAGGALGAETGESLYQLVQRARGTNDVPQSSLEAATQIGHAGIGGAVQEGIGVAVPAAGKALASRLYRTALKPSTTLAPEVAARVSDTLLSNRIPISEGGAEKLANKISGLNRRIDTEIATNPSATVNPAAIAKRVDPVVDNLQYQDLSRDVDAAAREKGRFINEHSTPVQYSPLTNSGQVPPVQTYRMPNPIEAERAQAMKKAIYREVYPTDSPSGYELARKAEARGIKEELENLFPNIKGLNAEEGKLLEAQPALVRSVNRTANNEAMGIGAPITAGAVNVLTGSEKLAALAALAKQAGSRGAIIADILSRPATRAGITPAALTRFGAIPLIERVRAYSARQ